MALCAPTPIEMAYLMLLQDAATNHLPEPEELRPGLIAQMMQAGFLDGKGRVSLNAGFLIQAMYDQDILS